MDGEFRVVQDHANNTPSQPETQTPAAAAGISGGAGLAWLSEASSKSSQRNFSDMRYTRSAILFGAALAALLPHPASAQDSDDGDRWKVSAEFSLTDQGGNKTLRLLTGGLNVEHLEREAYRLDAKVQSRYGRSEGDLVALNHNADLAFDFRPESTISPFLFSEAERDEFKRLDLRLSNGAGAKYTFQRDDLDQASLSLALLYTYERIAPADDAAPGTPVDIGHNARWSLRARTSHELRDGVSLRHTTFVQPVWDNLADYLLRSETGVKVLLTERLALSADLELRRDAKPPEGIEPNDRLFKTGLIIDF